MSDRLGDVVEKVVLNKTLFILEKEPALYYVCHGSADVVEILWEFRFALVGNSGRGGVAAHTISLQALSADSGASSDS